MKSRSIRKVLVTGGAGFIATAAVRQLMNEADVSKCAAPFSSPLAQGRGGYFSL